MMKKQKKVIYIDRGLANSYKDHIELNKAFKKDKKLRDYVVKHELGHIDSFDLKHEFKIDWKMMPSLLIFVLKNKSTWIDFLPIQRKEKEWIYDLNLMILYVSSIILLITMIVIFYYIITTF